MREIEKSASQEKSQPPQGENDEKAPQNLISRPEKAKKAMPNGVCNFQEMLEV